MNNEEKIQLLEQEISILKQQLEKYSSFHKKYYEKNKDVIIEKANNRLQKLSKENPDKIKEYARRAYLKQKEKKLKIQEENNL